MIVLVTWNGKDLPEELARLPKGRYVVAPVDEEFTLTAEQEEGLVEAMRSVAAGEAMTEEEARAWVERNIRR